MTSNPNTKNINGMRNRQMVNSSGKTKGVLDLDAIGKNGAIPVPGSRNFVNFSITAPPQSRWGRKDRREMTYRNMPVVIEILKFHPEDGAVAELVPGDIYASIGTC